MSTNNLLSSIMQTTFIVANISQQVREVYRDLQVADGQNWWYLVIVDNGKYKLLRFSDLNMFALRLGPNFFNNAILDLPLNTITLKTVKLNEVDADQAIMLAQKNLGKVLGITDEGELIGLILASTKRSDIFTGPSAVELYGILAELNADARVRYEAKAPPPICPKCKKPSYQKFDVKSKAFFCLACGEKIG